MPQHQTTLESFTGRFRFVPPNPAHDAIVAVYRTHPETLKHLRILPKELSTEEAGVRRESRAEDPRVVDFYVYKVNPDGFVSDELIAITGVFNIDERMNSCEIGILITPGSQGKGAGTEVLHTVLRYVFEERKFHRATFETAVDNLPMQKWLAKAGIRLESERREAWRALDGTYEDVKGYAILESEWREKVKATLEDQMGAVKRT